MSLHLDQTASLDLLPVGADGGLFAEEFLSPFGDRWFAAFFGCFLSGWSAQCFVQKAALLRSSSESPAVFAGMRPSSMACMRSAGVRSAFIGGAGNWRAQTLR